MCDVKPDPDPEICRGCLSTNRKLSPIASMELYYSLLTEDKKLKALSVPHIALCWECHALLQKIQRFLAQVERAHDILEDSIQLSPATSTLSSLTFHKKTEYDAIFEESTPPDQPFFSETESPTVTPEKVIIPTKYKTISDVSNDTSTPVHSENYDENEYLSDNSGDFVNIGADKGDSSSFEEIKDDDLTLINENEIKPNVELKHEGHSSPTAIQVKQNDKTVRQNIYKPKHVNRTVKTNITVVPFTKSPAVLKLEQELKKLMQSKHLSIKSKTNSKKELYDGGTKHKDIVSETKTEGTSNMVDTSKVDDSNSSNKRKFQKRIELEDPDFNLEATDEEYATDDSEEYKQVPQKKKKQSDTKLNSDSEDGESNDNIRKFKKTTTHYKKIADVIPYFTEIVMSQQDLKVALDKDDAIVDESKPYKCHICGMTYKLARLLCNHALLLHRTKYPNNFKKGFQNPPLVMPEKSVWQCHICDRMMRKEHIVGHMNTYHRSEYKCNACEWWQGCYWKKEDFDQHYESVHKQFFCDICEAAKRTKENLEKHIQEVHSPKPIIYKCSHCRKTFTSRDSWQRHERVIHGPPGPEELRYCVECDKTFKKIQTYKEHCRLKHSGLPIRK